nr:MAG TPA: hypothetical protein [Caudoviricetes sp.]
MKEKTYYEVLEEMEMEGKEYDRFKTKLSLGAICAGLVEQLQNDKQLNEINYTIPIEKQLYEISVRKKEV